MHAHWSIVNRGANVNHSELVRVSWAVRRSAERRHSRRSGSVKVEDGEDSSPTDAVVDERPDDCERSSLTSRDEPPTASSSRPAYEIRNT